MEFEKKPRHLAIIMDGNGRWAEARGHNRVFGHIRGAATAKTVIESCVEFGIEHLTLFAFSTENWFRPAEEVTFLMKLLVRQLKKEQETLIKNKVRFRTIGNTHRLPDEVKQVVQETKDLTEGFDNMVLTFALSYGGRQEIIHAIKKIADKVEAGEIESDLINEATLSENLDSSFLPDPDLIIRTSGEHRLSNFFLWQAAYSELYLSEKMWPDFNKEDLEKALLFFSRRERRYGRTNATSLNEDSECNLYQ